MYGNEMTTNPIEFNIAPVAECSVLITLTLPHLKGDTNAFSILVEKYKTMVFTLALKMVKSREEAEEISQDAFLKAYKYLPNFKGDSKFSTWIYRVAYNTSLDRIKSNKRKQNKLHETIKNNPKNNYKR